MKITKEIFKEIDSVLAKHEIPMTVSMEEKPIKNSDKTKWDKHIYIHLVIPDFFDDEKDIQRK